MIKSKLGLVDAVTIPNYSDDSVRIEAGSVVINNSWINYHAALFRLTEYIASVVRPPRTRFFQNRNFAVYLLIGLDVNEGIRVAEGRHVPFTTVKAVPRPSGYDFIPLLGIVVVQNGSDDLVNGYLPLRDDFIEFFNGFGNVVTHGHKGITGVDCDLVGITGIQGYTGPMGCIGITGFEGPQGMTGPQIDALQGATGVQGMTGINWQVNVPLIDFTYMS